jgi:hypothetical protein
MSTDERSAGRPPLYARLLRLRRIRITGLMSFLLMECTVAVAVLLALAELVSWWAVPLLPVLVAAVVKINDMVGAPASRAPRDSVEEFVDQAGPWEQDPTGDVDAEYDAYDAYDAYDSYDREVARSAEPTGSTQDWYADNPTQEIFLPPAVTGRPRQRSIDDADEYEVQPAYAGVGYAGYAEPAHTGYGDRDRSHAHTYAEPAHAGADWARHAAATSGALDDTYAGPVSAARGQVGRATDPVADRPLDAGALAGAGRHSGGRQASGDHPGGRPDAAPDRVAAGRGTDGWTAAEAGAAGERIPSGAASRPVDYWTRAAAVDAGRTTGASRGAGARGDNPAGTGQDPAGSGMPAGVPGSAAPRRAQLFGAAVRRSMAAQAQQLGSGGGSAGRNRGAAGSTDTGSGRHARGGSGGTTGGRPALRLNERGFSRLRDA